MKFRVLGPLEVAADDEPLKLGGPKQRALLTVLLLHAGRVATRDQLIDDVWGADQSSNAAQTLNVHMSQLRKTLVDRSANCPIRTTSAGYVLSLDGHELDSVEFERLHVEGRTLLDANDPARAADTLLEALGLWRGPAYADVAFARFVQAESARLEERRSLALEDRIDAELALGRHAGLVSELGALTKQHPLRERLWSQLILALYRSDRQADALATYAAAREALDRLGLEPSDTLNRLQQAVLRQDPALQIQPVPTPRRLPAPASTLVGRERELDEVTDLLGRPGVRIVTLTGPGGVGKTRLAIAAAQSAATSFDGGAVFVELAAVREAALALVSIAQALGLGDIAAEDSLQSVSDHLRGRDLLLVLDNLEQVAALAPSLGELVRGVGSLTVLSTSRTPLRIGGENEYRVSPLALTDERGGPGAAIRLFHERVRAVGHGSARAVDDPAIAETICRHLDGLPLAIELAAAWTRVLKPEEISNQLEDPLGFLTDGPTDLPARQQTLRATLEWSFALLEQPDQRILSLCAVFAGGWDLESLTAVLAPEDALDVARSLRRLHEHGLIHEPAAQGRFDVLSTVRQFALGKLQEQAWSTDPRALHAEYFSALAAREEERLTSERQLESLARVDREHTNIRAALRWLIDAQRPEEALELACALTRFWVVRGYLAEGRYWIQEAGGAPASTPLRRKALHCDGYLALSQGDYEAARALLEKATEGAPASGEQRWYALSLAHLGWIALTAGELGRAIALCENASTMARAAADDLAAATALNNLGEALSRSGQMDAAIGALQEGLALRQAIGDTRGVANSLLTLGRAELAYAADDAEAHLAEGLEVSRRVGDTWIIAAALASLGRLALDGDRLDEADRLLRESLALCRGRDDRRTGTEVLTALADVASRSGDHEQAGALAGGAAALLASVGEPRWSALDRDPGTEPDPWHPVAG